MIFLGADAASLTLLKGTVCLSSGRYRVASYLVIKLGALGDVVMASAMLTEFKMR